MKNLVIAVAFLLVPFFCFSQGIKFEKGSWADALALAKKTNKPVFVDIYTTWCGPCKKMSQDVFPLEEVGKVYNANFICCQIDAEQGEGIKIAKKYNVTAYPTYLFIKADGTLFYTALGSMTTSNFIEESKTALLELNDPKSIKDWDADYLRKKNDPQFLLDYINKRSRLRLSNTALFNEYLQLIPEAERTSDLVVTLYRNEYEKLTVKDFAYQNLIKNREAFLNPTKLSVLAESYLMIGLNKTVKDAAQAKNEALLGSAIAAYDQIPSFSSSKSKEEIYMDYYWETKEVDKYVQFATPFCNNKLMKEDPDSILQRDRLLLQEINHGLDSMMIAKKDSIDTSKMDTALLTKLVSMFAHAERDKVVEGLNKNAWYFFEHVSAVNDLQDALRWSERSMVLYPTNSALVDTYANLLYKLGRKEEAIAKEKEAIKLCSTTDRGYEVFKETLKKMESGERTWK